MHTIWSAFVNFPKKGIVVVTTIMNGCWHNIASLFKAPLLSRTYEKSYYPTALGLYFNYLVHGMGVILMSLNMASLETLWQTNAAGVSIVISSLGIGRLSVLLFAGLLSDRFGRRPLSCSGCAAIWPSFLASCTPITSLSLMFLAFWREWQTVFSMQAPIPVWWKLFHAHRVQPIF